MIAFREFLMAFSPLSQTAEELTRVAEPVHGPFVTSLREAAKTNGIDVLATVYESCDLSDRVYDSALWIGSGGEIIAVYRKLHLYDAFGFKESDKFVAGDDLTPPVESEIGRSGMMICYDLRFPELARLLTLLDAELIFAPSGWVQGDVKVEHWRTMIRARAGERLLRCRAGSSRQHLHRPQHGRRSVRPHRCGSRPARRAATGGSRPCGRPRGS
jgi:predicted amidohydrolase